MHKHPGPNPPSHKAEDCGTVHPLPWWRESKWQLSFRRSAPASAHRLSSLSRCKSEWERDVFLSPVFVLVGFQILSPSVLESGWNKQIQAAVCVSAFSNVINSLGRRGALFKTLCQKETQLAKLLASSHQSRQSETSWEQNVLRPDWTSATMTLCIGGVKEVGSKGSEIAAL